MRRFALMRPPPQTPNGPRITAGPPHNYSIFCFYVMFADPAQVHAGNTTLVLGAPSRN